jgi:catechol 2,3-dioxygenase-like lactoylglutathione lyase family enzyme
LKTLPFLCGLFAMLALPPAAVAAPPQITGVMVRVVDLDQALEFYREVAGFETVQADRAAGRAELVNGEVKLWLLKVETPVRHDLPGPSEAHLNLQIEKIDATLADLARRGVRRLLDQPAVEGIGPNMPIADPSGNLLYVIQLNDQMRQQMGPSGPLPRPRVFNYGITVSDMAAARKFYEGLLGFQVATEKFYPPVIPYLPAGVLQVVLHESATKAAAPPSPDTAQMNLVLEVDDLAAARRDLEARGGTLRASGARVELLDPFGNVHLLVERSAPGQGSK